MTNVSARNSRLATLSPPWVGVPTSRASVRVSVRVSVWSAGSVLRIVCVCIWGSSSYISVRAHTSLGALKIHLQRKATWARWRRTDDPGQLQHLHTPPAPLHLDNSSPPSTCRPSSRWYVLRTSARAASGAWRMGLWTDEIHDRSWWTAKDTSSAVSPAPSPNNCSMARRSSSSAAKRSTSQASSSERSVRLAIHSSPTNQPRSLNLLLLTRMDTMHSKIPSLPSQADPLQRQTRRALALPHPGENVLAHHPRHDPAQNRARREGHGAPQDLRGRAAALRPQEAYGGAAGVACAETEAGEEVLYGGQAGA